MSLLFILDEGILPGNMSHVGSHLFFFARFSFLFRVNIIMKMLLVPTTHTSIFRTVLPDQDFIVHR